jgi:hypothetical protein
MTTAGKNASWSIIIIVRKICRRTKRVSGTKNMKIDNCGKKEWATEMRGLMNGECSFGTIRNTPHINHGQQRTAALFLRNEALSFV